MKELALSQRKNLATQAAGSKVGSAPETRVGKFTNSGEISMGFTQPLKIPFGAETLIKKQTEENRRRLEYGVAPEKSIVQVFAVNGYIEDEDDLANAGLLPIMDGWELISLSADGFDLSVNFTDPLRISAGDEPDLLLIQLNLSDFEDADGNKLPESVVKYAPIPT